MKLYNGDVYELIKSLPDNSIDLIITDPPYEFIHGGGGGAFGNKKRDYHSEYNKLYHETGTTVETERIRFKANSDKKQKSIISLSKGFDIELLDEFRRVLKKTNIYIWCSKSQVSKILNYYESYGDNIDILTWHKTNPIPTCNGTYLSDTEYCVFAREKGVKLFGSYQTKRKYYVSPCNVADKKLYQHPTIKPLNIIKNLIINSSVVGGVILDPFMGSGTTGVACKQLCRHFIGYEIDLNYFEIAKNRINETGE